jgi:hypothetical protein
MQPEAVSFRPIGPVIADALDQRSGDRYGVLGVRAWPDDTAVATGAGTVHARLAKYLMRMPGRRSRDRDATGPPVTSSSLTRRCSTPSSSV